MNLCHITVIVVFAICSIWFYYLTKKVLNKSLSIESNTDEDPEWHFRDKFMESVGLTNDTKMFIYLPIDIIYRTYDEKYRKENQTDRCLGNRLIRLLLDDEIESVISYRDGLYKYDYILACENHWSKYKDTITPESINSAKDILIEHLNLIPSSKYTSKLINIIQKTECD